ncbi:MAG TPA: tRNA (adenosine(37)-N6)-threonylcarbamoyltransferase complex dimerization subunit type 1 TsaB [Balneolaceae bacterium]|nr:tRNA (adenosine(37)-N6)-threonylcarbamoyltransferase complex dimerization subunit type 1 TsaB [Balneolaceae bacterium]
MILAIETATNVCSVALKAGDGKVVEKRVAKRGSHSEKLFLFIEELMDERGFTISDLDAVLISEGPGSYTGLRIGASAVKGLLFETTVPLYGINTLASFAMQAVTELPMTKRIHSIVDARRVHVYHQQFRHNDGLTAVGEVEVIPIKEFETLIGEGDIIIGTGLKRLNKDILNKAHTFGLESITAKSLLNLFEDGLTAFYQRVDPETFDPKYYTSNQVQ